MRIFSDHMATPERLAEFTPYLDVWSPVHHHLDRPGADYMRTTDLSMWTYECGSGKAVTPVKNRALVWKAWRYGLDGVSYWTYTSGSSWNDLDGFRWGANPGGHHLTQKRVGGDGAWQRVTIKHTVQETPVDVGLGFDYGNANAETWIAEPEVAVTQAE